MKILLTGGTGMIGTSLTLHLINMRHKVTIVIHNKNSLKKELDRRIDVKTWKNILNKSTLNEFDAIINLAGEPISKKRWTTKQKEILCFSRWSTTEKLVQLIRSSQKPPRILISGSAIGYYGDLGNNIIQESTIACKNTFSHFLCDRWEKTAKKIESASTQVCLLRTGIVLSPNSVFLSKILPIFKFNIGKSFGDGKQYMSWIHLQDVIRGILWILNKNISGPVNLVSPYPIRNEQFFNVLSKCLNCSVNFRIPSTFLKFVMGNSSELVLTSQRAIPQKLQKHNFNFCWTDLKKSLSNILD